MSRNRTVSIWLFVGGMICILGLMACAGGGDESEESSGIPEEPTATATTAISPQEVIITRIVRQEVTVMVATPQPIEAEIQLDIGFAGGRITTLDPQRAERDNELDLVENLFAGLTRLDVRTGQVIGMLAESWEVSEDGLIWTFALRDDIHWVRPVAASSIPLLSEGDTLGELQTVRPILADDFVYAIRRACDPADDTLNSFTLFIIAGCEEVALRTAATTADLANIGVSAPDPLTVVFTLSEPASYFLTLTSTPLMRPIPPEIAADAPFNTDWSIPENDQLVSNGPYFLDPESILGTRIVLRRNPFWPHNAGGNVDVIQIVEVESRVEGLALWEERDLDVVPLPVSAQGSYFDRSPQKIEQVVEPIVFYMAFNYDSTVFSKPELRRAFSAAIDRERIIEEVYERQGVSMRHFSPPSIFGAPPVQELGVGYDPDFARLQLVAGGVTACRFLPPIRYMIGSSDAALFQAELIRDMWQEVLGCPEENIIIEQVQFGTLLANTRQEAGNLRPDVWDLGWSLYYPDAHNVFIEVLHCSESDNRMKRPCSEVDELLYRAARAMPEQRPQVYRRIEESLFGEDGLMPVAPIYARAGYLLRQTWVSFQPAGFGGEQFDTYMVDWELKQIEKRQ